MLDIITNKFYLKLSYIFISLSFATVISDYPFFNTLNKVVLLWGLILVLINLLELIIFRRRKIYFFEIFLYLFLALTLFLNLTQYKLNVNLKFWLVNFMLMTVIFSIDTYKSKVRLIKELNIISYFFTFMTFILSSISLVMIFINKTITIDLGIKDGVPLVLVYKGLFKNENSFGIAASLSILIALYLFFTTRNKYIKIFLTINITIQTISVFLSGGRSAYFPLLSLLFVFLLLKFKNIYIRLSIIFIPMAISITSFFTLPENILHKILTGREYLWMTAFRLLKSVPLAGVGNVNKAGRLKDLRMTYLQGLDFGGVHNIFLEISCINGIPATILFTTFIIFIFIFFTKKLESSSFEYKLKYGVLFALCIGIVLINLLESSLVYIISFISMIFWIYTGYLVAILDKEN
ncbi:hypothetical protein UT300007_01260 [Clostridium sp. CTA-7]